MRTLTEQPPTIFTRELAQQTAHVAATLDRAAMFGDDATGERARRKREIEAQARRELRALRDTLDGLPLE